MANIYSPLSLFLVCLSGLSSASITWSAYVGQVNKSGIDLIPSSTFQNIDGFYDEVGLNMMRFAANASHDKSAMDSCPFHTMVAAHYHVDPAQLEITYYINATESGHVCWSIITDDLKNLQTAVKTCADRMNSASATTGCCMIQNSGYSAIGIPGVTQHVKFTMHPVIFPIEEITCYGLKVGSGKLS